MRLGKIRHPQYRIVIADGRKKRDGRAIEEIGLYHPKEDPSRIEVNSERAQYWLSVGAQPSEPVQRILELTGDWQKFKGLPAPPPLKVAEPKADKRAIYEAEAKAVAPEDKAEKKPAEKKKPAKKATKSAKTGEKSDAKTGEKTDAKAEKKAEPKAESKETAGADAGTES